MRILAIETSCDETGIALVEASGTATAPRFRVIKNIVSSQIPVHRPFGGVVPNLAKREHIRNLPIVLNQVLPETYFSKSKIKYQKSKIQIKNEKYGIDLIAVTVGPGLEPALWAGITFTQELSKKLRVPLVGANHLEGHLYSFLGNLKSQILNLKSVFPAIALIVSGGHTILLKLDSLTKWQKLGETRDDAAGEAFDKVARLLGLPYPGGPEIAKLAAKGNPRVINFPRPMLHDKSYDFSFSGLKTAVLYYLRDNSESANVSLSMHVHTKRYKRKADVAASFQQAVVDVLVTKTMRAAREFGARSIILCGGVAANKQLRSDMGHTTWDMGLNFFVPPNDLNGDNAAMIAIAAYLNRLRRKRYALAAQGNLNV